MKFKAKAANTTVLEFNDLGTIVKGVSPQQIFLNLKAGDIAFLPEITGVLQSVQSGDAHRYAAAGLLEINEQTASGAGLVVGAGGTVTYVHNFGYIPNVSVSKLVGGAWVSPAVGDITLSTNAAMSTTVITSAAGGTFSIRIS